MQYPRRLAPPEPIRKVSFESGEGGQVFCDIIGPTTRISSGETFTWKDAMQRTPVPEAPSSWASQSQELTLQEEYPCRDSHVADVSSAKRS